jgi:hypothetical protein
MNDSILFLFNVEKLGSGLLSLEFSSLFYKRFDKLNFLISDAKKNLAKSSDLSQKLLLRTHLPCKIVFFIFHAKGNPR